MSKTNAYSYIRWSSEKQGSGDSLQRQLNYAKEVANSNNLQLVEIMDKGLSAFKSANLHKGELGAFIAAVEAGQIPSDSWLIVESLDRVSRAAITEVSELFLRLLRLGIAVYTAMDKKKFTKESVNHNPMELMFSLLIFTRANEEPETKSKRTKGNALRVIQRHQAGDLAANGFPYAIETVGSYPFFVDTS